MKEPSATEGPNKQEPQRDQIMKVLKVLFVLLVLSLFAERALAVVIRLATKAVKSIQTSENEPWECLDGTCNPNPIFFSPRANGQVLEAANPYRMDAQTEAQSEANYMRQNRIKNHVGRTIGDFEGCGWSSSPGSLPPTCQPSDSNYRLIADAVACDSSGCYRVRAWEKTK